MYCIWNENLILANKGKLHSSQLVYNHMKTFCMQLWTSVQTLISVLQTKSAAVRHFVIVREAIPQTSGPWLSVPGVLCWSQALWLCLWSCVLWSEWSLSCPWGLVKSLTTGLLRHTAPRPQYQNSHICRAAAFWSSKFMSGNQRDIRKTGCLAP